MSVNYSPYNKSYKYISLQNSLAHRSNLRNSTGLVDSNISFLDKRLLSTQKHTNRPSSANAVLSSPYLTIHRDSKRNKVYQSKIHR